jgi:hypothetical protein
MVEYISADSWLQSSMYTLDGRETHIGGITGAPDGATFAME